MIKAVMSIDSELLRNPSLLNFDTKVFNNDWLKVFTNAENFRSFTKNHTGNLEVWILSNDDIEAINLAAAVKKDRADCVVCLVCYDITGSLKSRAKAANIDTVISVESLKERIEALNKQENIEDVIFESQKKDLIKTNNFEINKVPQEQNINSTNNKAFILSVLSASGGAGKSSVATMCSVLLKTAGFKTLIIDADFQFGDIVNLVGDENALYIDEVVKNPSVLSKLKSLDNLPSVIAAPKYAEYAEKILEIFPQLLDKLSEMFDVIVVNSGSFWGEQQAILLEKDSKSLFLIDQRASSINATKRAIDLCERCGIAVGSVLFAINKCSKQSLFSSIDVSCALKGSSVAEIMDGGMEVDEFLTTKSPLDLIRSKNSFAISLWTILESIIPDSVMQKSSMNMNNKQGVKKSKKSKGLFKKKRA